MKIITYTYITYLCCLASDVWAFNINGLSRRCLLPKATPRSNFQKKGMRRSMVAMEPERASGKNDDIDKLKPPTSIRKPEELVKSKTDLSEAYFLRGIPAEELLDEDNNVDPASTASPNGASEEQVVAELIVDDEKEETVDGSKTYRDENAIKHMAKRNVVFRIIHRVLVSFRASIV